MTYCKSPFEYSRRHSREVNVGGVAIGGTSPIAVQSMLTSDTMDTDACVAQTAALVDVGCQIVRITAPTKNDAANLGVIREALAAKGMRVALVADIHFKPEAAMEAAKWIDKVRINPGNFADKKKFQTKEYSAEEYEAEVRRTEEAFAPLVLECKRRGVAMRIGTNHGSLSDRILNYYGDTPLGMVESAMEFARVARKHGYHDLVFSMKASNPKVMIEAYRLLAAKLGEQGPDWNYPIHLGVTEAGEGEDGRIKSAIGIGALLHDGIGDTIRVSLTEDSPREIPVCRILIEQVSELARNQTDLSGLPLEEQRDPFSYARRPTDRVEIDGVGFGGEEPIRVVVARGAWDELAGRVRPGSDVRPEGIYERIAPLELDPLQDFAPPEPGRMVTLSDACGANPIAGFRILAAKLHAMGARNPILLKDTFHVAPAGGDPSRALLASSTVLGALICDGIGDAIMIRRETNATAALKLAFNILQAAGSRSFKTDYVACPSCGRTLFDLQVVTARIKARTAHLKGVKIAIMGCIVNGPGEMADADFGYVGGAPGKINLYVGKTAVKFNIPETEAVDRLVDLIREHGKWRDPAPEESAVAK